MAGAVLQIDDIHKSFGGLRAISKVSFDVEAGQLLGLIGPNGAGKTTIFNIISGIYRADHGRIVFNGQNITNWQPMRVARLGIARTFQVPRTFKNMTVEENLLVSAVRMDLSYQHRQARVLKALEDVSLIEQRHKHASELSSGEQQLLQFARAILSEPELILLDEPFGGASPGVIDHMVEKTVALARSGVACLVISHDIVSLPRVCEQVIVLTEGAVLTQGPLAEVREDPRVIEAYLGG